MWQTWRLFKPFQFNFIKVTWLKGVPNKEKDQFGQINQSYIHVIMYSNLIKSSLNPYIFDTDLLHDYDANEARAFYMYQNCEIHGPSIRALGPQVGPM